MTNPIETGNVVLIILGVALVVSGPWIIYRTIAGILEKRKSDPGGKNAWFSNGLNFIIAILFFFAGILFIVNNLRGNPLA